MYKPRRPPQLSAAPVYSGAPVNPQGRCFVLCIGRRGRSPGRDRLNPLVAIMEANNVWFSYWCGHGSLFFLHYGGQFQPMHTRGFWVIRDFYKNKPITCVVGLYVLMHSGLFVSRDYKSLANLYLV